MSGSTSRSQRKFWTAGGLRPADLERLRSAYAEELPDTTGASPSLVILCGLPGTGKSHFARELVRRAPFVWLNSDRTRKLLVDTPSYSRREHRRVFSAMHVLTRGYLRDGYSVVFDATNLNENVRRPLYSSADAAGVEPLIIRFTAPSELVRRRLTDRAEGVGEASQSDATWDVYSRMAVADQPVPRPHLLVTGPEDAELVLQETLRRTRSCRDKN
ncbi:MAG: ATP-binding protein [Chloroflexota bacterium]|nr:ATP-binding protein [Chloroflexota bacterium]MDE2958843.1 ATP-binding protein [Chloroflexota bacterium]